MKKQNKDNNELCNSPSALSRRKFITMAGAGVAFLSFPMSSVLAKELLQTKHKPKIVWVLLRGALDSLHTIGPRWFVTVRDHILRIIRVWCFLKSSGPVLLYLIWCFLKSSDPVLLYRIWCRGHFVVTLTCVAL